MAEIEPIVREMAPALGRSGPVVSTRRENGTAELVVEFDPDVIS